MAQIIVTVPDTNVPMVRDAIRWIRNDLDMTDPEIIADIQSHFESELRRLVKRYQRNEHTLTFDFIDPLAP
jgi:hypothetical protein